MFDTIVYVLLILIWPLCLFIIGLVLLQGGAGDMSSAFGGGGQLDSTLGVGAGRKMSKLTGWLVFAFLVIVTVLAIPHGSIAKRAAQSAAASANGAVMAPPATGKPEVKAPADEVKPPVEPAQPEVAPIKPGDAAIPAPAGQQPAPTPAAPAGPEQQQPAAPAPVPVPAPPAAAVPGAAAPAPSPEAGPAPAAEGAPAHAPSKLLPE